MCHKTYFHELENKHIIIIIIIIIIDVEYIYGFVLWGSASKVDDVTALPSRHKMADMYYYGNVMTTTRWWLCVTMETL